MLIWHGILLLLELIYTHSMLKGIFYLLSSRTQFGYTKAYACLQNICLLLVPFHSPQQKAEWILNFTKDNDTDIFNSIHTRTCEFFILIISQRTRSNNDSWGPESHPNADRPSLFLLHKSYPVATTRRHPVTVHEHFIWNLKCRLTFLQVTVCQKH